MYWGTLATGTCLLVAGCSPLVNTSACKCGADETQSKLSCDSKNYCEGAMQLVGHTDLGARGMNSALALAGNYAYIGSRTDGGLHAHGTIAIVDVSDPSNPQQVGELGGNDESVLGLSSRELRAVPDLHLLYVLNLYCSAVNDCSEDINKYPGTGGIAENENLKIYDINDPVHPALLSRYDFANNPNTVPFVPPHEFFLWRDPNNQARILLYVSHIYGPPSLEVIDATNPRAPVQLTTWDSLQDGGLPSQRTQEDSLHSMSVSDDGMVTYLAHFGQGFFMLDSTQLAKPSAIPPDQNRPMFVVKTPVDARVDYSPPYYPGTHSAVKVPNRELVVLTDEVYPNDSGAQGCPWGWGWMVDITNPLAPTLFETTDTHTGQVTIFGQMRLPFNDEDRCPPQDQQHRATYSAHNPTVTQDLVIATWYGGGLQAFDITDPVHPVQVGAYYPDPMPATVEVEEPGISGTKTLMWSYPILRDGLIYAADIRNGLYIVRYSGPHSEEITAQTFLEGNSNVR